jgi:hypothetical protein
VIQLQPRLGPLFIASYDTQDTVEVFEPASTEGTASDSKSESYITPDGQSASLSWNLGLRTRFLLLSDSCGFVDMGRSL